MALAFIRDMTERKRVGEVLHACSRRARKQ